MGSLSTEILIMADFFWGSDGEVGVPESDEQVFERDKNKKIRIGQDQEFMSLGKSFMSKFPLPLYPARLIRSGEASLALDHEGLLAANIN